MIRDILLVDDDLDDVDLFREALNEVDALVNFRSAKNGLEALELLHSPQIITPDLIFLDINMPEVDGWRCLAEIKSTPLLKEIPVIIYSTSAAKMDEQRAAGLGAKCIYQKPERFEDLKRLLKTVIGEFA
jgi:CheY-like chemotaxis protein